MWRISSLPCEGGNSRCLHSPSPPAPWAAGGPRQCESAHVGPDFASATIGTAKTTSGAPAFSITCATTSLVLSVLPLAPRTPTNRGPSAASWSMRTSHAPGWSSRHVIVLRLVRWRWLDPLELIANAVFLLAVAQLDTERRLTTRDIKHSVLGAGELLAKRGLPTRQPVVIET